MGALQCRTATSKGKAGRPRRDGREVRDRRRGDPEIASALLDRLLQHATTVNIKGEPYRLKEKRRAGLPKTQAAESPAA
jgi:hypothetical protein